MKFDTVPYTDHKNKHMRCEWLTFCLSQKHTSRKCSHPIRPHLLNLLVCLTHIHNYYCAPAYYTRDEKICISKKKLDGHISYHTKKWTCLYVDFYTLDLYTRPTHRRHTIIVVYLHIILTIMLWKRGNGKIKTLEQTKPQRHRCDIHSSNPYIAATSMVSRWTGTTNISH